MTDEPSTSGRKPLRTALAEDVGRAIAMTAGGALAFGGFEYVATLHAYAGSVGLASKLRLVALVATLSLYLAACLLCGLVVVLAGTRLVWARVDATATVRPGVFALGPLHAGIRRDVPRLWALVLTGAGIGAVLQRGAQYAITHFKEPQLTSILIAILGLGAIAVAVPLYRAIAASLEVGATALAALLTPNAGARIPAGLAVVNPLGRWRAAGTALATVTVIALAVIWKSLPQARSVLPVRLVLSAIAIATGLGLGNLRFERRAVVPVTRARRRRAGVAALATLVLVVMTLLRWGANLETKYLAITASPALAKLITLVRYSNDLDRDGFGSLLGEGDCAPFVASIHPGAIDIPSNGIDENCDGKDLTLSDLAMPEGEHVPVPPQFQRTDWNVLFLTIDTLRYDSTTFGGYATGPKHRDTTPRLAELVKQSVSFTFANAPSAGTMASIPAILTSKFFHSGIALDENRPPGTPPKILPENTTLPEIMRRANYHTAVVASHEWWNDWGLDQGVAPEDYDNSIGSTPDPYRVAADRVTDHVLAWISRHQSEKWFMWAHYIDPHGRYVAHPDVIDYGSSEPDLYDGELRWTDQEVGRLLDELKRLPSYNHTIIVITSDHGDSMGEHNVPVGTHGTALYRELQHVPLIFYIPNNRPRLIDGAVSGLDIVPTIADLCGIDVHDLSFEGRSLVPQLFYGKADHDRIVFAETNAPDKQRAAISEQWKLIYYLSTNVLELFDLKKDPWEHVNLAAANPPALAIMKRALDTWMQRVLYARDPVFNSSFKALSDLVFKVAPSPQVPSPPQSFADGAIDILGIGIANGRSLVRSEQVDVHVYFHVNHPTQVPYKLQLVVFPLADPAVLPDATAIPVTALRSALRTTGAGAYASNHWAPGEYIRERFPVAVPNWKEPAMGFALTVQAPGDQVTYILGQLPMGSPPPKSP